MISWYVLCLLFLFVACWFSWLCGWLVCLLLFAVVCILCSCIALFSCSIIRVFMAFAFDIAVTLWLFSYRAGLSLFFVAGARSIISDLFVVHPSELTSLMCVLAVFGYRVFRVLLCHACSTQHDQLSHPFCCLVVALEESICMHRFFCHLLSLLMRLFVCSATFVAYVLFEVEYCIRRVT